MKIRIEFTEADAARFLQACNGRGNDKFEFEMELAPLPSAVEKESVSDGKED